MNHPDEIIWCDCGTDALTIMHDVLDDPGDPMTEIGLWSNTGDGAYSWLHRIRQAWRWLRGSPQTPSSVVLTPEELARLRTALSRDASTSYNSQTTQP